jgi:tripartite-type tricarboxylate transporter receptor subunit TctC
MFAHNYDAKGIIANAIGTVVRVEADATSCPGREPPAKLPKKRAEEGRMGARSPAGVIALLTALALTTHAWSQAYPDRPVRMVIAFPAGGTIDTLGRILAQKLTQAWGQNVVIENRPGGGGNIGAVAAAKSASDGTTLHFGAQSLAVNVTLQPTKDFDPVTDLEPIILVGTAQDVLLVPLTSPFHSVKDLIDYAKRHPGELNYGSLGTGTSGHLATVLFSDLAGIKLQHVPYTSVSQATTDIISGRLAVFLPTLGGHIGNVTSGRLRALAVSGTRRAVQLPEVPTFNELGVKFVDETSWYALFAPKGTPREIIVKVNADVEAILAMPDVREKGVTLGYRYVGGPPEKLAAFLQSEIAKWADVAKSASLK